MQKYVVFHKFNAARFFYPFLFLGLLNLGFADQNSTRKGWDLLILRELVLENSPDIKSHILEVEIAKENLDVLRTGYWPSIKARTTFNDYAKISNFETYSEPDPYETYGYSLDARWTLYNGFKTRRQLTTGRKELSLKEYKLALREQEILKDFMTNFFDALKAQTYLELLPEIQEIANACHEMYERQFQTGVIDTLIINESARNLEGIRTQILNNHQSFKLAKAKMAESMNCEISFWNKYEIFIEPPDIYLDLNESIQIGFSGMIGSLEVEVAQSKYDEIKSERAPVLEFTSSAGHRDRGGFSAEENSRELTVGLSLTFPISDFFVTARKLKKSQKEIYRMEALKDLKIQSFRNLLVSQKLRVEHANESLDLEKSLYALQKKRYDDLNKITKKGVQMKSALLTEEKQFLRKKLDLRIAQIELLKEKYILDTIK